MNTRSLFSAFYLTRGLLLVFQTQANKNNNFMAGLISALPVMLTYHIYLA